VRVPEDRLVVIARDPLANLLLALGVEVTELDRVMVSRTEAA
jgi:hypothetical protein